MRLFVAVNLGSEERARLEPVLKNLREYDYPIRWLPSDNVHLTLKFLGDVSDDRVPELTAAIGEAVRGVRTFEMLLGDFGAFPSARRPNVVWIGVEPSPQLEELHRIVEGALEPLGFSPERRRFRPHLTIGRARKRTSAAAFRDFPDLLSRLRFEATVSVRSVDLMRSRLKPTGAVYEVLHRSTLET